MRFTVIFFLFYSIHFGCSFISFQCRFVRNSLYHHHHHYYHHSYNHRSNGINSRCCHRCHCYCYHWRPLVFFTIFIGPLKLQTFHVETKEHRKLVLTPNKCMHYLQSASEIHPTLNWNAFVRYFNRLAFWTPLIFSLLFSLNITLHTDNVHARTRRRGQWISSALLVLCQTFFFVIFEYWSTQLYASQRTVATTVHASIVFSYGAVTKIT